MIRCYDDPEYDFIIEKVGEEPEKLQLGMAMTNEEQKAGKFTNSGVIDSFVDCILNDTVPAISGEDGLSAMKVIFAAEESNRTGQMVLIDQN